jgi:large subunit ribosomal protein L44
MQNAQRRLASTATAQKLKQTISLSSVRTFPPPQALTPKDSKSPVLFDPDAWAVSQSPPPAALTAFAHRVGLGKLGANPRLIQQACTHQSITLPYSKLHPNRPLPLTNTNLATLGNSLLGLFATEFVHASYPHLPTRVAKAAVSAYVGPTTCADVAREMGVVPLLRWYRVVSSNIPGF